MLGNAVDHDGVAVAFGQRLGHRDIGIEAVAMLVERRDGKRRSEPHRACIRLQDSGEHVDQRGLAAAVRTDDADAVAALDADREIADDRTILIAFANSGRLDDLRAGRWRRTCIDGDFACRGAIAAALLPQCA